MVRIQLEPVVQLGEVWIYWYVVMFRKGCSIEICVDEDLKNFVWDLGKEGFVLQLISLAGLHVDAVSFGETDTTYERSEGTETLGFLAELSRQFKEEGMLAYIKLVQSKEREMGLDILTHQKWYDRRVRSSIRD